MDGICRGEFHNKFQFSKFQPNIPLEFHFTEDGHCKPKNTISFSKGSCSPKMGQPVHKWMLHVNIYCSHASRVEKKHGGLFHCLIYEFTQTYSLKSYCNLYCLTVLIYKRNMLLTEDIFWLLLNLFFKKR